MIEVIGTSGKALLRHMLANKSSVMPSEVAERLKLFALSSDTSAASSPANSSACELETLCREAIVAMPEEAAAMRSGHKNVANKLVGWVMKKSRGRADAKAVKEALERLNPGENP
jgi:aspartyl-tRNA(Asn)/glutamyl-tRNA(Gln) amidotransferase subunit B